MKKLIILICALVLIAIIAVGIYLNIPIEKKAGLFIKNAGNSCVILGELVKTSTQSGPPIADLNSCCAGLTPTFPVSDFDGNCTNTYLEKGPSGPANYLCLQCGDGNCDPNYENRCNCPNDCGQQLNTFLIPKDLKDLNSCVSKSDCEFVEPKTCCRCYEAINKKYAKYWGSLSKQDCNSLDIVCQMCQYYAKDLSLDCINNVCQANPIVK